MIQFHTLKKANNYLIIRGRSGFDGVIEENSAGSRDDLKNQIN